MQRALVSTLLAVLLGAAPLPALAAPKFKKTHLTVTPQRLVNLAATIDPSTQEGLTLDGLGSILILQKYALIVTDVIVTPIAAQDTTTPIWVNLTLGGRGFEIRRLGAQTHHISLGGAIAATPNQPLAASNASSVQIRVNVMGYLVDGAALESGVSPEN